MMIIWINLMSLSHFLIIASLLIELPLECECKSLVCLLKRPVLLSLTSKSVQSEICSFSMFGEGDINDE